MDFAGNIDFDSHLFYGYKNLYHLGYWLRIFTSKTDWSVYRWLLLFII